MGASMNRNSWTSPFGLAFLVGSLAALVAGFATGSGMRGGSELNMTEPGNLSLNLVEPYVDENALVAANREPAPTAAAPPPPVASPAPEEVEPAPPSPASPPTVRRPLGTEAEPDAELLPPEPRDPPRRRRNREPPPDEEFSDEPPGF